MIHIQAQIKHLGLLSPRIISQPDNATFPGRGGGHLMHDIKKKTFVLLEFQRARRAQKFYAGGLLLSSHKARGGDAQGNKTNTLPYGLNSLGYLKLINVGVGG